MADGYDAASIEVLKRLEKPFPRARGHVIEVEGESTEDVVPDAVMRTVYLTVESDAVLRQMASGTDRTRSGLVAEILERGLSTPVEALRAARPPFDTVMRSIQLPSALDAALGTRALEHGITASLLVRTLVDLGARPLFDGLSDTLPRDPGAPA